MEPQNTDVYVKLHKCTDFLLPEYIFNKQPWNKMNASQAVRTCALERVAGSISQVNS